ncbi:amidohydrolase [Pareuzebyella sediminis]|uniref:amidohydrolase n=1 Tax=Pareuzebyella sediminis TaxID=2607998 RepID=UPI0011ECB8BF|nr:amidohydrolase [Pareuzebyella sediminis]
MDKKLHTALVQTTLYWEDPARNRAHFAKKIDQISMDVDLIVFPEMFTTGFTMAPYNMDSSEGERTLEWMRSKSREKNVAMMGSISFHEHGSYANRLFFVQPNGKVSWYDKRHTFTLAGEDQVYVSGKKKVLIEYKGFNICPMICYDLRFPVWARNTINYDVIVYVANWPEPRILAWDTLLRARAIENMAYCVGVNRIGEDESGHRYCGHSGIYDTLGAEVAFSDKEEIVYATLSKQHIMETRKKLRFLDDRDTFNLLL